MAKAYISIKDERQRHAAWNIRKINNNNIFLIADGERKSTSLGLLFSSGNDWQKLEEIFWYYLLSQQWNLYLLSVSIN